MSVFNWIKSLWPHPGQPIEVPAPEPAPDPSVRIHKAAHDPHFPEKREKAIVAINDALTAVAAKHGFTAKPQSWIKAGPLGQVSFYLQRSRFGFDTGIHLVFHPTDLPSKGVWAEEEDIPLAWFYPEAEAEAAQALIYLDVLEQPEKLRRAMVVLSETALPWLVRHLDEGQVAEPEV